MPPQKRGRPSQSSNANASSSLSSSYLRGAEVDPYYLLLPPCEPTAHAHGKANCAQNARCLFGLGEKSSRGIWAAEPQFLSILGPNPSESKRAVAIRPAGMHNLGATCYLNALMQALFFNLPFRALIYAWRPHPLAIAATAADSSKVNDLTTSSMQELAEFDTFIISGGGEGGGGRGGVEGATSMTDAEKKEFARTHLATSDAQDMLALQRLFSDLHLSLRSAVNVHHFVNRLQLEAGYQQDANEFSKKLMEHIGPILDRAEQLPHRLRNGIKDMFCGRLETMTKCLGCKRESTRVENFEADGFRVPFRGKKNLEDALQALFAKETMAGENSYECESCKAAGGGRQPADRSLVVLALPPVLNIQLVRFEYNLQHGDKEKVKDAIEIPDIIDLAAIVRSTNEAGYRVPPVRNSNSSGSGGGSGASSSPPSAVYELTAVLYHKGQSAHHGHYIADVWDPERALWWHFDDETVTPVASSSTTRKPGSAAFVSSSSSAAVPEPACDDSEMMDNCEQNISNIRKQGRVKHTATKAELEVVATPGAPLTSVAKPRRNRNSAASIEEVQPSIKKYAVNIASSDVENRKHRGVSHVSEVSDVIEVPVSNVDDDTKGGRGHKRSTSSTSKKSAPQIRISDSMMPSSSLLRSTSILRKKGAHAIGGVPPLNPSVFVPDVVKEESIDAPHNVTTEDDNEGEEVIIDRSTWTRRRSHPLFRTGPGSKDAYMLVYSRVDDERLQQWQERANIAPTGTSNLSCLPPPPQDVYIDAKALFTEAKQGSSSSSYFAPPLAKSTSSSSSSSSSSSADVSQPFDMNPPAHLCTSVKSDNHRFKKSMTDWANERIRRLALIDRRRALYSVLFLDPYSHRVPQDTTTLYTSHGQRAPTLPLLAFTDLEDVEINTVDSSDEVAPAVTTSSLKKLRRISDAKQQSKEQERSVPSHSSSSDSSEPIFYWLPTSWLRMWISGDDLREIEAAERVAAETKRIAKLSSKSSKQSASSLVKKKPSGKEIPTIDLSGSNNIDLTGDNDDSATVEVAVSVNEVKDESDEQSENEEGDDEKNNAQGEEGEEGVVDLMGAPGNDGVIVNDLMGDPSDGESLQKKQQLKPIIPQKSSSAILASSSMDDYQRRKPTDIFHDPVWSVWIENPSAAVLSSSSSASSSSASSASSSRRPPLPLLDWLRQSQSASVTPFLSPEKAHLFKAVSPRVFHSIMEDVFPSDDPNLEVAKDSLYLPASERRLIANLASKTKSKAAAASASTAAALKKTRKVGQKRLKNVIDDDEETTNESIMDIRDDAESVASTAIVTEVVKSKDTLMFNADARMAEILSLSGSAWSRRIHWDVASKHNLPSNWALSSLNYRDSSLENAFLSMRIKAEKIIDRNVSLIDFLTFQDVKDQVAIRLPPPPNGGFNFYWIGKQFVSSFSAALKSQNKILYGGPSQVASTTSHFPVKPISSSSSSSSSSALNEDNDNGKVSVPQQSTLLNLGFTINGSSSDMIDASETKSNAGLIGDMDSRSIVSAIVENPLYGLPSLEDLLLSPLCDFHQALKTKKGEVVRISAFSIMSIVSSLYGRDALLATRDRLLPADELFQAAACMVCKEISDVQQLEQIQDSADRQRETTGDFKKLDIVRKRDSGFPVATVSSGDEFEGKIPQGEYYVFAKPWLVKWRNFIGSASFSPRPDSFPAPWTTLQCTCNRKHSAPRSKVPLRLLQFVSTTSRPNYAHTPIRSSKKSFFAPASSSFRLNSEHHRRSSARDLRAEEMMRIQSTDFPRSIPALKDSSSDNSFIIKLRKGLADWKDVTDSNFCGVSSPMDPVLEHDFAAGVELILPEEFELFNRLYKWIPEGEGGRGGGGGGGEEGDDVQDISEEPSGTSRSIHLSDIDDADDQITEVRAASRAPFRSSTDDVMSKNCSSSSLEAISAQHKSKQRSCPPPLRLIVLNRFEVCQRVNAQDVNSQQEMIVVAGDNHTSFSSSERSNPRSALTWTLDPPLCSACFADTCSENLSSITSFDNGTLHFVERLPTDAVIQEGVTASSAAAAAASASSRPKRSRTNKARISTKLENLASSMRMYDIRMRLLTQIDEANIMQAFFYHPKTNQAILGNPTLREANIRDGDEIKYSLPGADGSGDTSCIPTHFQDSVDGNDDAEMVKALAASASMSSAKGASSSKRGKEKGFTGSRFGGAAADAAAPNSSRSGAEPKKWTCRMCTFENAAGDRKCAVCGGGN